MFNNKYEFYALYRQHMPSMPEFQLPLLLDNLVKSALLSNLKLASLKHHKHLFLSLLCKVFQISHLDQLTGIENNSCH